MLVREPKYRKQLGKSQIKLVGLIGKFRFVTVPLVAEWQGKDRSTIYERLTVLESQGYIQKRYEQHWRLLGKPAVYSLTAKGLRILRDHFTGHFTEAVLRNQYKNNSASLQLVDHSLAVAKLCLLFKRQHGGAYDLFLKSEMDRSPAFLRPLPDLYIRTNRTDENDQPIHYQLEMIEAGTLTWIIRKRINAHQTWYEEHNEEGWEFEDSYPTLLLVCGNENTEKRVHRLVDEGYFDFTIYTTTSERLESGEREVWLEYWEEDEVEFKML